MRKWSRETLDDNWAIYTRTTTGERVLVGDFRQVPARPEIFGRPAAAHEKGRPAVGAPPNASPGTTGGAHTDSPVPPQNAHGEIVGK